MRFVYGFAGVFLALGLVLYPLLALSFSSGAPATFNGGPTTDGGFNPTCVVCHGSFELNSGDGSVSIEAPASFLPGETIDIVVTVENTTPPAGGGNRQGFELSAQLPDGTHVGTLGFDNVLTQLASGNEDYVTHTSAGNELSTWTIPWTAPVDAPDAVTFYAAGNAANGDGSLSDDYIYTTTLTVPRAAVANEDGAAPLAARIESVYPNPFVESAQVAYTLVQAGPVTVTLYDGVGRVVRVLEDGARGAGDHTARVEASGLAAGVYFVEVRTPDARMSRPLTLGR
ncbi:MAG: choice-of-anchor V domain-containing protein [Rhodothermales bacterium]